MLEMFRSAQARLRSASGPGVASVFGAPTLDEFRFTKKVFGALIRRRVGWPLEVLPNRFEGFHSSLDKLRMHRDAAADRAERFAAKNVLGLERFRVLRMKPLEQNT